MLILNNPHFFWGGGGVLKSSLHCFYNPKVESSPVPRRAVTGTGTGWWLDTASSPRTRAHRGKHHPMPGPSCIAGILLRGDKAEGQSLPRDRQMDRQMHAHTVQGPAWGVLISAKFKSKARNCVFLLPTRKLIHSE